MRQDTPCPDCGAAPGGLHAPGCDVEQCPYCGGQLISCGCGPSEGGVPADDRLPWAGEWPGQRECRELGWYARRAPVGWAPCPADAPGAIPDLNRLHTEAVWDREGKRFVRRPQGPRASDGAAG
jgi:hypothetical protein